MPTFEIQFKPGYSGVASRNLRNLSKAKVARDHVQFILSESEYQRLQQSIAQKWVYASKYLEEDVVTTAYYIWCISTETPFVKVTRRTANQYRCEFDTYTTPYDLNNEGLQKIEELFTQNGVFRGRHEGSAWYDIGDWSVCEHIDAQKARAVAHALLEIANTNRSPVYTSAAHD